METLMLPFTPRFVILTICCVVTVLLFGIGIFDHKAFAVVLLPLVVFGALSALGFRDLMQTRHAVLRNYPISAHMRFLLEEIRPELRQYFFESEKDGRPFSRDIRALNGLPVSTTHVLSSGIAGTMAASGSGLQWATIRNIALAWVLTLPASMILSGVLYYIFYHIF